MCHPTTAAQHSVALPRWLKPANRVLIGLHRMGWALGNTIWVLSVPGRKSGRLRTTPVSLLRVEGQRYVVGGMATADWVRNARAAGWGVLAHGRHRERVALVELPLEDRTPILRAFPRAMPGGLPFFQRLYGLPKDPAALPEAFAALAPQCTVFRIDPVETL
jgi:deazaflavin-dependent oxidoreductase (nitroreductase family)